MKQGFNNCPHSCIYV